MHHHARSQARRPAAPGAAPPARAARARRPRLRPRRPRRSGGLHRGLRTLWEIWTPLVFGRVFGGPVFWAIDPDPVVGSDRDHHGVGIGSTVTLPAGLGVFVEWAFLGERALAAGASWSF